jgi:serine/threonine protein phosphatase 1
LYRFRLAKARLFAKKCAMRLIPSFLRRLRQPVFDAPIAPDRPFFAIGDIHGNYRPLERVLEMIDARSQGEPVITVGDYVDRGPDSARVLSWLQHLTQRYPADFICLKGNHEVMMLDFLDRPDDMGPRWLNHGGLQTLASYRIGPPTGAGVRALRDALAEAMGDELIAWMRALPIFWQSGNVTVTHAGADPALPVDAQDADNMIWGHADFGTVPRDDGRWIVHGHRIVETPSAQYGIISIDTGSYATQRLTVAHVAPGRASFFSSAD